MPYCRIVVAALCATAVWWGCALSAQPIDSVLLAVDRDGNAALVDPLPLRSDFVSPLFQLAFGDSVMDPRNAAGATRMSDGRILAAIEPLDGPWSLFELDPVARRLIKLTELEGVLSSIAADDDGNLFGVTFEPARLVRIDPSSGNFTPIGPILHLQGSVSSFQRGWASLWFDADRDRLLYLFFNHDEDPTGALALDPNGGVPTVLTHELNDDHRAEQLVFLDEMLWALSGGSFTALDVEDDHLGHAGSFNVSASTLFGNRGLAARTLAIDVGEDLVCIPTSTALCLGPGRAYRVSLDWQDPGDGEVSAARVIVQSDESGMFWFVDPSNIEAQVKILDACGVNGHRWVFGSASTDLAFTLRVREMATGIERSYSSPPATAADAITDAAAFPCDS